MKAEHSNPPEWWIYDWGPGFAHFKNKVLVCSSLPSGDAVQRRLNAVMEGGREVYFLSPTNVGGEPNPCPCDTAPDTHKHYMLQR